MLFSFSIFGLKKRSLTAKRRQFSAGDFDLYHTAIILLCFGDTTRAGGFVLG
jgi:hypothetical protein